MKVGDEIEFVFNGEARTGLISMTNDLIPDTLGVMTPPDEDGHHGSVIIKKSQITKVVTEA
jgi:hypothetical protein